MTREEMTQLVTRHDLELFRERLVTDFSQVVSNALNTKEFYTPREFSDATGMKYSTVIHYCNTGRLKARQERSGGAWTIHVSELERFAYEAQTNVS